MYGPRPSPPGAGASDRRRHGRNRSPSSGLRPPQTTSSAPWRTAPLSDDANTLRQRPAWPSTDSPPMVPFPEFSVGVCACCALQHAYRRAQQFPFSDCITRSDGGPIPAAIEAVGLVGFDSLAVRQTFERKTTVTSIPPVASPDIIEARWRAARAGHRASHGPVVQACFRFTPWWPRTETLQSETFQSEIQPGRISARLTPTPRR